MGRFLQTLRGRGVLAVLSALSFYAAFPPLEFSLLAWIGPGLLILTAVGARLKQAFVLGFLSGLLFHLLSLSWIVETLSSHGEFKKIWAVSTLFLLAVILAIYWAIFTAALSVFDRIWPRYGFLLAPPLWVGLEFARTYVLTGFPWNLLGYSQYSFLSLIQIASICGVYGVSFIVVGLSSTLCALCIRRIRPPEILLALYFTIIVALPFVAGLVMLSRSLNELPFQPLKVACIQTNTPQERKWDSGSIVQIFAEHKKMTKAASGRGSRLVLWSESSVPLDFESTAWYQKEVTELARLEGIDILLGSTHAEISPVPPENLAITSGDDRLKAIQMVRYFNSAFMVHQDGSVGSRYDKMHLVPFSEYNPYRNVFWFFPRLVNAASDFTQGTTFVINQTGSYSHGTFICYEAIFPDIPRVYTRKGAHVLVNITNDAWFGESAAPTQHFLASVFRAVENRRWVVRCANTGISAFIDPNGRIHAATDLMEQTILIGEVRAVDSMSWYTRHGDVFAWIMSLLSAALLLGIPVRYFIRRFKHGNRH
ncbi:apolipoprotein N-acyltransferase [Acidobacteriota bacterium]